MEFLVDSLKKNRKASYADLKAKADEKKLKLFPIMFGRAQAMLGIVKSAKRGTGKFAKASAAAKAGKAGSRASGSSKSDKVRALLATGMSAADIAKKVGYSKNTVSRDSPTLSLSKKPCCSSQASAVSCRSYRWPK